MPHVLADPFASTVMPASVKSGFMLILPFCLRPKPVSDEEVALTTAADYKDLLYERPATKTVLLLPGSDCRQELEAVSVTVIDHTERGLIHQKHDFLDF